MPISEVEKRFGQTGDPTQGGQADLPQVINQVTGGITNENVESKEASAMAEGSSPGTNTISTTPNQPLGTSKTMPSASRTPAPGGGVGMSLDRFYGINQTGKTSPALVETIIE